MQKTAIPQDSLICRPALLKDIQNRITNPQLSEHNFSNDVIILTALEGAENYILGAISSKKPLGDLLINDEGSSDKLVLEELDEIESFLPVNVLATGVAIYDKDKNLEVSTVLKRVNKLNAIGSSKVAFIILFHSENEYKSYKVSENTAKDISITLDATGDLYKIVMKDQYLLACGFSLVHAFQQGKAIAEQSNEGIFEKSKSILQIPDAELSVFTDLLKSDATNELQEGFKSYIKGLSRNNDPKKKKSDVKAQLVQLKILFSQTSSATSSYSPHFAVSIEDKNLHENKYEMAAYVNQDTEIKQTLLRMISKLSKNIAYAEQIQRSNPAYTNTRIGAMVFEDELISHAICAVFPLDSSDRNLKIPLHLRFNFPLSRPFFNESLSLLNKREDSKGGQDKLKNVHNGLNYKGVDGGERALIYGDYVYYHYGQDGLNDKGWGCAYRSLQTLISWFIEQKYAKDGLEVPSIDKIQKILVEMGDKDPKFIGSKEWIGAFEVNLVLNKLLDIDSKIMHVSDGVDVSSRTRELFEHFNNEGTPIMIGGGVLAYTLLGVDFNDDTGECNFLILDPHYGGAENVKTIQEKGWCQWKGPKIFLENTFYNFCLPQRAKYI